MKTKSMIMTVLLSSLLFSCSMNSNDNSLPPPEKTSESSENTKPEPVTPAADPVNAAKPAVSANRMLISPDGSAVTFTCKAESTDGTLSYQWYSSPDGSEENKSAIDKATSATYTTEAFTQKEIRYYFCTVTNTISDNGDKGSKTAVEIINFSAAYTGLPTVLITTPDSAQITSKEDWMKDATLSITGAENDEWNFAPIKTSIRGRGNSTWGQPKKPYALKLDEKQSLLGMKKHKRWVLIANYLDNSFMRNSMAFYLSEQFGMDWTVHGHFVNLILNDKFQGLYWLGEAIKADKNRIDINDGSKSIADTEDKDYLIEMDVYYDEPVKFYSGIREMPYMIKNDDYMIDDNKVITSGGSARLARLKRKILSIELLLYPNYLDVTNLNECSAPDTNYSSRIDDSSWAKFWLVNEIMDNGELGHPKSCYFTYDSTNNMLKAGPVWDFDWASLSQGNSVHLINTIYYNALFKSDSFKTTVKNIWNEKSSTINISDKIEEIRNEIKIAAVYDSILWGVNHNPNPSVLTFNNFDGHVDFLKETLQNKKLAVGSFINNL